MCCLVFLRSTPKPFKDELGRYQSISLFLSGPTLPVPDFVEWDDDGRLHERISPSSTLLGIIIAVWLGQKTGGSCS
jgi:hypothetical protein